jgi:hypothetical protein
VSELCHLPIRIGKMINVNILSLNDFTILDEPEPMLGPTEEQQNCLDALFIVRAQYHLRLQAAKDADETEVLEYYTSILLNFTLPDIVSNLKKKWLRSNNRFWVFLCRCHKLVANSHIDNAEESVLKVGKNSRFEIDFRHMMEIIVDRWDSMNDTEYVNDDWTFADLGSNTL